MSRLKYVKILLLAALALGLASCGSKETRPLRPRRARPRPAAGKPAEPALPTIEHKRINPEKPRRNPFLSYIIVRKGREAHKRIKGPLECCDLDLFRVMAVVLSKNGSYALVSAPDGKRYIVRRGDRMGLNGGRIIRIYSEGLKVREYARDDEGRIVSHRDRTLKILTREEGGITRR